jgi:hypothetical protein
MVIWNIWGGRWRIWLKHCATSRKDRGFDSPCSHWGISLTLSFRPHYSSGVDSASNINEYQEDLQAGKDSWCVELTTLPPSCADCLKIPEASTSRSPKGLHRDSYLEFLRYFKLFNYLFHNTSRNSGNPGWGTLLHGAPSQQTAICNARSFRNVRVLWR